MNIVLPYPPSVNHYYRRVGHQTLISREGRAYRERVCATLRQAGVQPVQGLLSVELVVHPPDRRRRDIDNILKALLDAMKHGGAYEDDSQVKRLAVDMQNDPVAGGKVTVTVKPLMRQQ